MDFAGGFFTIRATDMFLNILLLTLTVTLFGNGVFADIYIYIYIYTASSLFIPVDGYLGCFHVLAIVNSAAVNTEVHVSFWTMFFHTLPHSSCVTLSTLLHPIN